MNGQRGYMLIELLVTIAAISAASLAFVSSVNGLHRENTVSKAYCDDIHGMRRAVRMLRDDLRNAESVEKLEWALDGDHLKRDRRVVATNVRAFEVKAVGDVATARLVVGGRHDVSSGKGVELSVRVRMRNAGRSR